MPNAAVDRVLIVLRVDSCHAALARQVLHACLGDRISLYSIRDDHRTGRCIFQVRLRCCSVDTLMSAIMAGLPEAEFGAIRAGARAFEQ